MALIVQVVEVVLQRQAVGAGWGQKLLFVQSIRSASLGRNIFSFLHFYFWNCWAIIALASFQEWVTLVNAQLTCTQFPLGRQRRRRRRSGRFFTLTCNKSDMLDSKNKSGKSPCLKRSPIPKWNIEAIHPFWCTNGECRVSQLVGKVDIVLVWKITVWVRVRIPLQSPRNTMSNIIKYPWENVQKDYLPQNLLCIAPLPQCPWTQIIWLTGKNVTTEAWYMLGQLVIKVRKVLSATLQLFYHNYSTINRLHEALK